MALVALAVLAFPPPAAAQSTTTFVSNTNQGFLRNHQTERDRAQRFTTGSHANGYDLSGVRLMFGPGYLFLSVSVCMTDTNGFPTSSCTPLRFVREFTRRTSGIPVNPGLYTAPSTTVLHPNTTYTVLVRGRNEVRLPLTRSNANDAGASSGWSIGDAFDCFNCGGGAPPHTWVPHDEASLQIQILGTERSAPIVAEVSSVAVTSTPALTSSGASSPDTYAVGEPIYFTVTFNNGVAVTGDPEFEFSLANPGVTGNDNRRAAYDAGRSTARKVVFAYTVQAADEDTNGIWVGDQTRTFQLDGDDSILTSASGVAASLAHRSLGTQSAHKVVGTRSPPAGEALDPPLTASWSGPPEHDGRTAFKLTLTFSEEVTMSYRTVRERLFTVSGATIREVRRLNPPSNLRYELTVRPSGSGAVTLARAALPACGESDTICTADGRALEGPPAFAVPGPAVLSVEDATVEEGPGAALDFAVTLDRERHAAVTVDYATSDGSATAGQDYTAASGMLTFAAGETAKSVSVAVLDDTHVEGLETLTLSLSSPTGARIADGEAVGTIENPQSETEARFIASLSDVPAEHDGRTPFPLTLTFSEEVSMSYETVRDNLFTVSGGTIPKVRRLNPPSNLRYEVTVQPGGNDPVTLARAALPACGQSGSICTSGGRALEGVLSATVPGPPVPLTASLSGVPAEHDGDTPFTLTLTFSEEVPMSYETVRDNLFTVSGGTIPKVRRLNPPSNRRYEVTVDPGGNAAVTLERAALPACGQSGSICTPGGRALEGAISATVPGLPGLSVADARVDEAENAKVDFAVTLSRASTGTVTVAYATSDDTATQGNDYVAASGTLTFAPGETEKTVSVTVRDDDLDEGEETFTLTLSNASGGNVFIADASATGTIVNTDPLPRALMARFGRTAAMHVVEQVEERLQAPREPGLRGRFAGRELRRDMGREMALSLLSQLGGTTGGHPAAGVHNSMVGSAAGGMTRLGTPGLAGGAPMSAAGTLGTAGLGAVAAGGPADPMIVAAGPTGGLNEGGLLRMGLGGGDMLSGSAFALNRETGHGGVLSFWSRGARSHFAGREGALSLGGDVRTTMFGADYAKGPLVTGLSLSHSRGLGEYAGIAGGQAASAVTGLYPWLGYKATDRVTVWGVAGYGYGGLRLTPEGGPALESGLSMAMAAAGTRGELVAGVAGGFALAFKADALWSGTSIDGVDGPAGRLKATEASVTRFRTGLEGSRDYALARRLSLTPSVEVGLRHDGGDAEKGAGMDVGAGLIVSDPSTGLAVDVRVRTLLVHQAEGFREWGGALSLGYNPTPSTPLGFVARVAPSWGGEARSGAEALWGRATMAGMAHGSFASGNRLNGEVGYGLPVASRFVGTPRVGFGTSEYGRDYRVGYSLGVLDRESLNLQLSIDAQRRETPMLSGTDHRVLGHTSVSW